MNDRDEIGSIFIMGVIVGMAIASVIVMSARELNYSICERKYDVYRCEVQYVPVERESK